jgi:hypothetical protein
VDRKNQTKNASNRKKMTTFGTKKMKNKLEQFYMKCYLPELIDPRTSRNMPIRDIR